MAYQTVFERVELKYLLSEEQKQQVLQAMKSYMSLDQYGRTTIRNIYFDTDNYRLVRHSIEGPVYKEKLRIRSYSQTQPNGSIVINDGYIVVCGPTQGDTATLDYDTSAEINGGTFIGTGAMNMAQTFSSSAQGVISVTVSEQEAGTQITVTDQDGNEILSYTPQLAYNAIIISSPELVVGNTYIVNAGTISGETTAK